MTTTKTLSKADMLRAALKAAGYNARQVTVRHDSCTLRVTVRSARVSLAHVEEIAGAFEKIDRDQATGEILCGGNTFVDASYDRAVLAPHVEMVEAVLRASSERVAVQIGGHRAFWSRDGRDEMVHTLTDTTRGRTVRAWGVSHGAEAIAIDLLSRGEVDAAQTAFLAMPRATQDAALAALSPEDVAVMS